MRYLLSVALITFAFTANAEEKYPLTVIKAIAQMEQECKNTPGKADPTNINIKTPLSVIKSGDYNGDGVTDYLLNDSQVDCEIGATFRHGDRGTGVTVYAGKEHGAVLAYNETVWDVQVRKDGSKESVWVSLGGLLCGQKDAASFADTKFCWRQLVWSKSKNNLELAPMAQKQMIQ